MHIYIIFTKFKLCAGAFKRVRNRHVTWFRTNMADQREIDTRVVKSSLLIWILDFPSCFFQKKINEKSKNSLLEEDIW